MVKKFSLLMAAVAVLAFAVPSMASAVTGLTSKAGVLAPVGTEITTTNVGEVQFTSSLLGTLKCKTLTLHGEITQNNGTQAIGKGNGKFGAGECFVGAQVIQFTKIEISDLRTTPAVGGVGQGDISFAATVDWVNGIECTFTGTNVPFTYVTGSSHITFQKAGGIKGGGCGTTTLDATFSVEIGASSVILD